MKNFKTIFAAVAVLATMTVVATPVYGRGCCGSGFRGNGITQTRGIQSQSYFNEQGMEVNFMTRNLRQDADGNVMFGRGCWYLDADGNMVSAWNSRVFDVDGNAVIWGGAGWGDCCVLFWGE